LKIFEKIFGKFLKKNIWKIFEKIFGKFLKKYFK